MPYNTVEKKRAHNKRYRKENLDSVRKYAREYMKKYRIKNHESCLTKEKEYREKNKEHLIQIRKKYRATGYYERYHIKNKEEVNKRQRDDYFINPDKYSRYHKRYAGKSQKKMFEHRIKTYYQLSMIDYEELFEKQNRGCAICGGVNRIKEDGKQKFLCVDHDHSTGKM